MIKCIMAVVAVSVAGVGCNTNHDVHTAKSGPLRSTATGFQASGPVKTDHPLRVTALMEEARELYQRTDPIRLRVEIRNVTDRVVIACKEDWQRQKGVLAVEAFDEGGSSIRSTSEYYVDYKVSRQKDLEALQPGEAWNGMLDVGVRGRTFEFWKGTYYLVVEYRCPFSGELALDDGIAEIVAESQRSEAVAINVDYRPWFRRIVD